MAPDWHEIKQIFLAVVELSPGERVAFWAKHEYDESTRLAVENLLEKDEQSSSFLENGPSQVAQHLLYGAKNNLRQFATGDLIANRFLILELLAAGGMGEVYRVLDQETRNEVALKTIREGLHDNPQALHCFRAEVSLAKTITHRNVSRVYDLHSHQPSSTKRPTLFLTMELLSGDTLHQRIVRNGPLDPTTAWELLKQLASALAAAHEVGIVHRDLKAANVILEPEKAESFRAVVMDFGLAIPDRGKDPIHLMAANIGGTFAYMAPEQRAGLTSAASDVYSLGVVMFEALTGRKPKPEILTQEIASLSRQFQLILSRCLQANVSDRFSDAGELLKYLSDVDRGRLNFNKGVIGTGLAAALLIASLVAIGIGFVGATLPRRPTIAVFDFQNLSALPRADYLGTVFSSSIAAEMSCSRSARVISGDLVSRATAELSLPKNFRDVNRDQVSKLHKNLGADLLVSGLFLPAPDYSELKIYVTLTDLRSGTELFTIDENGTETQLAQLISRVGYRLRKRLQIDDVEQRQIEALSSRLPESAEALRLYSEGVKALHSFNAQAAARYLKRAVEVQPEFPLAHAELANAWSRLGYDALGVKESSLALQQSGNLPWRERLLIDALHAQKTQNNAHAVEVYRQLISAWPDNVDYRLLLVSAQSGVEALSTIAELRKLKAAEGDARVDLAEAKAAQLASNYVLERAAAKRALANAESSSALLLTAEAKLFQAFSSYVLGATDDSHQSYQQAAAIFESYGDWNGVARALEGQAMVLFRSSKYAEARDGYNASLGIVRRIGSKLQEATTINGLAMVDSADGHLDSALQFYQQSAAICRMLENPICLGRALNNEGYVSLKTGDLERARTRFDLALKEFKSVGAKFGETYVLASMADLAIAGGKLDQAFALSLKGLELSRQVGDKSGIASASQAICDIQRRRGQLEDAFVTCQSSLKAQTELSQKAAAAKTLVQMAQIEIAMRRPREAIRLMSEAMPTVKSERNLEPLALAETVLAEAQLLGGDKRSARNSAALAEEHISTTKNVCAALPIRLTLASLKSALGRPGEAKRERRATLAEARRLGMSITNP